MTLPPMVRRDVPAPAELVKALMQEDAEDCAEVLEAGIWDFVRQHAWLADKERHLLSYIRDAKRRQVRPEGAGGPECQRCRAR
jgi:hypothetical protein